MGSDINILDKVDLAGVWNKMEMVERHRQTTWGKLGRSTAIAARKRRAETK